MATLYWAAVTGALSPVAQDCVGYEHSRVFCARVDEGHRLEPLIGTTERRRGSMPSSGEPLDYHASVVDGDVTYRQQYRRCGKQLCSRCAPGQRGHGPYWYAYRSEGGRRRIRYVGKELPPGALAVGESVVESGSDDLQVRTLGGFEIRRGNAPVSLSSRRAASLFKCLLGASEHRLARDEAMELLWPEADPNHAAASLRTTVYLLRRALDVPGSTTHILTEGEFIRLTPAPSGAPVTDWLDVESFERLAEAALAGHDIAGCRAALDGTRGSISPTIRMTYGLHQCESG